MPAFRYLFCINPGRSGSQFLAELLATDPQVAAFHEAAPKMNADTLRLVERQPYADTYAARRHKADACRALLLAAGPAKRVYAETSHMFIKTFADVAMREFNPARGEHVGILILRRELSRVVKSFVELGIYTPRNPYWPDWMPSVEACTRAIEPAAPEATLTSVERTVTYLVDIEARAQRFRREYPHADVFETRLEALTSRNDDGAEARRLFAWAGLEVNEQTLAVAGGQAVNDRARRKTALGTAPLTYEEAAAAVQAYLARCRRAGVELPASLATNPL